jgi:hypothetical protein
MKEYPLIELPGLDPIEAEKGEVIVNPSGAAYAIGGKSHAQGGTKMVAEPGSYILSKHLKLDRKVVKALGYKEGSASPAELSKKSPTDKYLEIMNSEDDDRYDDLAKKTAALMFQKNAARQDMIYEAQEQMKAKKGMKNDLSHAQSRLGKFQSGGAIDPSKVDPNWGPWSNDVYGGLEILATGEVINQGVLPQDHSSPQPLRKDVFGNAPNFQINNQRTLGWSERDTQGVPTMYSRPFANDPFFSPEMDQARKTGKYTAAQKKLLGERQQRLSSLSEQFKARPDEADMIQKEYAKYLKAADSIEQDQFIDKFVIGPDGKEIPLSTASDEQIDQAKGFRYHNKRTGKDDVVDYRDRQNQGFDPVLRYQMNPAPLDTTNLPISRMPVKPTQAPNLPNLKSIPSGQAPGEIHKGMDWQSIINGTQIGLLAADLATTRTKPPYYDYAPSEIAYTRFEPINTKQQERAFNIAAEQINNSNMSSQQKAAYLSSMYGQMAGNVNQVDITNYQNKLANDNRNISLYDQRRNTDIQRQQDSNLKYTQEADRRNYQAAAQRQAYMDNMMGIWSDHVANRRDVGLVNQLSRNYDYSFNNEQVDYVPGQGSPVNNSRLKAFKKNDIDPRYLNAEGLRALGFTQ